MLFRRRQESSPPLPSALRCSFCNKSQHLVKKLIAGPNVYICDECVGVCIDILKARVAEAPVPFASHCSICGAAVSADALQLEPRGVLCPGCVAAIKEALEQNN